MAIPPTDPEDHTSQPRPCSVFSWDILTGGHTATHLPELPREIVQLDDGTRLTLDEYLARKEQIATPGEGSLPSESR